MVLWESSALLCCCDAGVLWGFLGSGASQHCGAVRLLSALPAAKSDSFRNLRHGVWGVSNVVDCDDYRVQQISVATDENYIDIGQYFCQNKLSKKTLLTFPYLSCM